MATSEDFTKVMDRLNKIEETICSKQNAFNDQFLDNQEFIQLMNISKRTAQNWRDDGLMPFSQIGHKVYYLLVDVKKLLQENYHPSKTIFSNKNRITHGNY